MYFNSASLALIIRRSNGLDSNVAGGPENETLAKLRAGCVLNEVRNERPELEVLTSRTNTPAFAVSVKLQSTTAKTKKQSRYFFMLHSNNKLIHKRKQLHFNKKTKLKRGMKNQVVVVEEANSILTTKIVI
jgi:hypothetical protein